MSDDRIMSRPPAIAGDEWERRWAATFGPAVEVASPPDVLYRGANDRRHQPDRRKAGDPRRGKHRTGSGRRTGVPDRRRG